MPQREIKLRLNQLTLQSALSSLGPKKARFWARAVRYVSLLAVASCIAGCAGLTKDSAPDVKAAAVKERAQARWQALIKGDLDAAYAFLSPASKAVTPIEAYRRQVRPGLWRTANVDSVECNSELCVVKLQITYDVPRGKMSPKPLHGVETPISESWIIENGSAWFVYR
jgi:hypothetical protein